MTEPGVPAGANIAFLLCCFINSTRILKRVRCSIPIDERHQGYTGNKGERKPKETPKKPERLTVVSLGPQQ
jgi:hypothetical protein